MIQLYICVCVCVCILFCILTTVVYHKILDIVPIMGFGQGIACPVKEWAENVTFWQNDLQFWVFGAKGFSQDKLRDRWRTWQWSKLWLWQKEDYCNNSGLTVKFEPIVPLCLSLLICKNGTNWTWIQMYLVTQQCYDSFFNLWFCLVGRKIFLGIDVQGWSLLSFC